MNTVVYPGSQDPVAAFEDYEQFFVLFCSAKTPPSVRANMLHTLKKEGVTGLKIKSDNPYDQAVCIYLDIAQEAIERDKPRDLSCKETMVWQTALRFALQTAHLDSTDNDDKTHGVQAATWINLLETISDPWLYADRPGFALNDPLAKDIGLALNSGFQRSRNKFKNLLDIEVSWTKAVILSANVDLFFTHPISNHSALRYLLTWLATRMRDRSGGDSGDIRGMMVAKAINRVYRECREYPSIAHKRDLVRVGALSRLLIEARWEHLLGESLNRW